jgi:hypothetical protein
MFPQKEVKYSAANMPITTDGKKMCFLGVNPTDKEGHKSWDIYQSYKITPNNKFFFFFFTKRYSEPIGSFWHEAIKGEVYWVDASIIFKEKNYRGSYLNTY